MREFSPNMVVLEPIMRQFIQEINEQEGSPIYELSPKDARKVLLKVQDVPVAKLPADIEDLTIPTKSNGEISIRIIRPKDIKDKLPVVMYFHGGGWILGDKETHDRLVREIANGAQAAVVFVNFSRSPEAKYPTAIQEAYAATKYIAENGKSLNIDSSRIAVVGDSVGGNMATVVAIMANDRKGPKISYQILFYPVTDANFNTESYKKFANGYWLSKEAMKWFWDAYCPDKEERKKYTVSPLLTPMPQLEDLPSALIITNECDVLRDEGEIYAHKLMQAGVSVMSIRLLGAMHDCLLLNPLADSPVVKGAIELANYKLREVFKNDLYVN